MLHTCIEIHARWLRAHEHDVSRPSEISTHSENPINVYATKREAFIIPSLARWPRRTRRTHAISEYKCLVCVCMRASVCARSFDYLHVMQRIYIKRTHYVVANGGPNDTMRSVDTAAKNPAAALAGGREGDKDTNTFHKPPQKAHQYQLDSGQATAFSMHALQTGPAGIMRYSIVSGSYGQSIWPKSRTHTHTGLDSLTQWTY